MNRMNWEMLKCFYKLPSDNTNLQLPFYQASFALILLKSIMYYAVLFLPFRKRLEQQQKMLEEDRKRRQFEEQKQKLRLLSSVKPKVSLSPHLVLLVVYFLACPLLVLLTLWTLDTRLCCAQTGEKSRDDALEAIKGNLDGFSRDAKMHPTPSSQTQKPGTLTLGVKSVFC